VTSFVVDPTKISESAIFLQLIAFIETRPDAAQWETFFQSDVGFTVTKLMSGLSTYFTYNNVVGRREAYIQHAENLSSVVGISQYLGYSAFRGRNPFLTLNVIPNFTGVISKFTVVGDVKGTELVALEDVTVNDGFAVDIPCVVGDLKEDTLLAESNRASLFRFTGNGTISDTVKVSVDGVEVEISDITIDLIKFKFLVQTNAVGSVDIFSTNGLSAPVRFDTGDEIKFEWIELRNLVFLETDVQFNFGTISEITTDSVYTAPEEVKSVAINAPLQHEVQQVIRAREDQPKQFKTLDTTIIDTTGEDVTAAVMRVFYLRQDQILFDPDEKSALIVRANEFRVFGIAPVLVGDPTRLPIKLRVDAVLLNSSGDPVNDIKVITQKLALDLQAAINLDDLEKAIEDLPNIKTARPKFQGTTWVLNTKYEIGTHVIATPDTGRIFFMKEILYFSAGVEPIWPVALAGETIVDGDIVWKSIAKNDTAGIVTWAGTTAFRVGDQVKPSTPNGFIFEAFELQNESDSAEPTWTPLGGQNPTQLQGALINDGDIVWIARPEIGTPPAWTADTVYKKGDTVLSTDQSGDDNIGVMWQAFAYLGQSGGSQPAFPVTLDLTVIDNNILWETQDPLRPELLAELNEYFTIVEDIVVTGP